MSIEFFEEWKEEGISIFDNDGLFEVCKDHRIVASDVGREEAFEIARDLYKSRNRCGCRAGCNACLMLGY